MLIASRNKTNVAACSDQNREPPVLKISAAISIPTDELKFTYSRSPGPGGQNVNKVNTKATLTWDLSTTAALPDEVLQRFKAQNRNRITRDDRFVTTSSRYRDQPRNAEDCLAKLRQLLLKAIEKPKPRKPTKPSAGARRRRLEAKRKTSDKKMSRRRISPAD